MYALLSELDQRFMKSPHTFAFLLLFLHLLQSLEHASQVSDAILKSNLLIFRSRSRAEDVPHVHFRLGAAHLHGSDTRETSGGK